MAKKSRVFDGKCYYLWNSAWRKGDLSKVASDLRKHGLQARIVIVKDKYAPKDKSYELYVYGSVRDLVSRRER